VRRLTLLPTLLLAAALLWPAVAGAASPRVISIKGAPAAGPAKYDRTTVRIFGRSSARRVVVLVPGTGGGAGSLTPVARELVRRLPDHQVWAWDRRTQAFEDVAVFEQADPGRAFGYYFKGAEVGGRRFTPVGSDEVPFVRDWGLRVSLEDLRRVVLKARAGGRRKVILGGHSLGAATTLAYASWDFRGRPGYRDLSGMVLIDGGLLGAFGRAKLDDVKRAREELKSQDAFNDTLGLGAPWATGVFSELAALYARKKPNSRSALQDFPLIPEPLRPPVSVTNEALLGYVFDASTSPDALRGLQLHAGRLAPSGDPRRWRDGELSPIQRVAATFAQEPANAAEWYFPRRLFFEILSASELDRGPVARLLRLRTYHRRRVNVPLYSFETTFLDGAVNRGARAFQRGSRVPKLRLVSDRRTAHLDPLTASPRNNRFLQTVVSFLRDLP